jgi:hypothetical protein
MKSRNTLEIESKSRQLEAREREWAEKLDLVESDRDQWKRLVEVEKVKNSKLIDQVVRKDPEIHRMQGSCCSSTTTGSDPCDKPRGASGTGTSSSTTKSLDIRYDAVYQGPHPIFWPLLGDPQKKFVISELPMTFDGFLWYMKKNLSW